MPQSTGCTHVCPPSAERETEARVTFQLFTSSEAELKPNFDDPHTCMAHRHPLIRAQ